MKRAIILLLWIVTSYSLQASECYHYRTSKSHEILKNERGVFYQYTEIDPNGISYVRQIRKTLKGVDLASFILIGEEEETFTFNDKNGFYSLRKSDQYDGSDALFYKILPYSPDQKHINGRLFLIDHTWTYLDVWGKHATTIRIKNLPTGISEIKSYVSSFYVKTEHQVFSIQIDFYDKTHIVTAIPNLKPAQLFYYACKPAENEDYIADEKHIYAIRRDGNFEDITPQFLALGIKNKYNQLKLLDNPTAMWWNDLFVKKRDGHAVSGRNPLTGEEIDIYYAYAAATPLVPTYGEIAYIRHKTKIYPIWDDNFSLPYLLKGNALTLEAIDGILLKGKDFYYAEADDRQIISTQIHSNALFFPSVRSYGKYLSKALVDKDYIHFIHDRFDGKTVEKIKLTSKKVKQLGLFYFFNDALFDGENSFPIQADAKTFISLGSFVEVIRGCAGDMPNTDQVIIVHYHSFFKDKDAVYYFNDITKQLQRVETANTTDFTPENYDQLQELYKIKDVKRSVLKKSGIKYMHYFIPAICIVLGFGFYWFKRKE